MRILKQSIFISFTLALMLAFMLVTTSTAGEVSIPKPADETAVRCPDHGVNALWDSIETWDQMTKAEQDLWEVVGWNQANWEGDAKQPASEDKYFNQLKKKEKEAMKKLGYTKSRWDTGKD